MESGRETGERLIAVSRAIRHRFGHALAAYDVTPGQARALRVVGADADPPRLSTVAERLRIAPRSATEVIDALEARGWVQRQPDPADRRATCVALTAMGSERLAEIAEVRRRASADFFSVLSADDRAELDRLLDLLDQAVGRGRAEH